jgi:hypothetical protein
MDRKVLAMVASENFIPEEPAEEKQGLSQGNSSKLKKCPFCAELIQQEAIKCKHCGEFLDGSGRSSYRPEKKKWYYSTPSVIIGILFLGAVVIPFIWKNPYYKTSTKIILSAVSLAYTAYCIYLIISVWMEVIKQLEELGL